jgi:hypothetical protein
VLLGSVAAGVGSSGAGPRAIAAGAAAGFTAWVSWAAIVYFIGTRVLPEPQTRADLGQLLRTLAFAAAPGLVHVFGIVPALRWPAFVVAWLWMLAAMIVAVRQALDYSSTARAVAVCAIGWALSIGLAALIGGLFPTSVS